MVLGIKVTNVTMGFHKFFQCRLLVDKIRLAEENPAATAVGTPCCAAAKCCGHIVSKNAPITVKSVLQLKKSEKLFWP
jgi:hypothetical protein